MTGHMLRHEPLPDTITSTFVQGKSHTDHLRLVDGKRSRLAR